MDPKLHPDTTDDTLPSAVNQQSLLIIHRNVDTEMPPRAFSDTLGREGLGELVHSHQQADHWTNRTFGLAVSGAGLTRHNSTTLISAAANTAFNVVASAHTSQPPELRSWLADMDTLHAAARGRSPQHVRLSHAAAWQAFWNRSHIMVGAGANASEPQTKNDTDTVTRKYAATRYVQALQSQTDWPIKYTLLFNGMLFGSNLPPLADFRDWGANNWWQNTRLPYWNMFASGDQEALTHLFEYYLQMRPLLEDRTQTYFGHAGIFTTETKTLFGLFTPPDYSKTRGPGEQLGCGFWWRLIIL